MAQLIDHIHMRSNRHKGSDRTKRFELVFGDVYGPFRTPSFGGYNHLLTFTDDSSQDKWIKAIHKKSLMLECFQLFLSHIEENYYSQVATLRTTMEGEWFSSKFKSFINCQKIVHQCCAPMFKDLKSKKIGEDVAKDKDQSSYTKG